MSTHQVFADALLAVQTVCPSGLSTWNGSDPGRRFAVYRNNVMVSLIDALADSFPVTQELVGEDFFRAMARLFVQAHPPRSPVLAWYGGELPAFIDSFAPASEVPYLADVARLELLRVRSFHAADAVPLPAQELARLLDDAERLPATCLVPQPSLGILRSRHAVVSLWAAHQAEDSEVALARVDPDMAEAALVLRIGLEVEITRIEPGTAAFIVALQRGDNFGSAVAQALAEDAAFDLVDALQLLIRGGAICRVAFSGGATT